MSSLSLYNISEELRELLNYIQENDGVLSEEDSTKLAITRDQLATKVVGYDFIIKTAKADIAMLEAEESRITLIKNKRKFLVAQLEGTLLKGLLLFGEDDKLSAKQIEEGKQPIKRLTAGSVTLSTRKSKSTEIDDESIIPDKYCELEVHIPVKSSNTLLAIQKVFPSAYLTKKPIKKLIKEDLDKDIEVAGAYEFEKVGLTIK